MRGTSFYNENKLAQRDLDRKYLMHRQVLDNIKSRHKSTMLNAQGLRAVEVRPGFRQVVKVRTSQPSRASMTEDTSCMNKQAFFSMRRRHNTSDLWGASFKMNNVRRSQDIQGHSAHQETSSMGSPSEHRRNLKTAGRVGIQNMESQLLSKDIVYQGNSTQNSMHQSLVVGNKTRIGKSSDATAFRRSLVINQRILHDRDGSSPHIRPTHQTMAPRHMNDDGDSVLIEAQASNEASQEKATTKTGHETTMKILSNCNSLQETPYNQNSARKDSQFSQGSNSVQRKLYSLSFQERERQREINKQNKLLLGQLLQIERDYSKSKKVKTQLAPQTSIQAKQWAVSSVRAPSVLSGGAKISNRVHAVTTAPVSQESHAGRNKRRDLIKIDHENARLFVQLSKKSCSVYSVDKLKAEYERAKEVKRRISKSKRTPATNPVQRSLMIDTSVLRQKQRNQAVSQVSNSRNYADSEMRSFQQIKETYHTEQYRAATANYLNPMQDFEGTQWPVEQDHLQVQQYQDNAYPQQNADNIVQTVAPTSDSLAAVSQVPVLQQQVAPDVSRNAQSLQATDDIAEEIMQTHNDSTIHSVTQQSQVSSPKNKLEAITVPLAAQ